MKGPEGKTSKRKKRKWLKRTLIAGVLLFAAAGASPFLFTTALVRYAIGRSSYRDLPLSFRSATLRLKFTETSAMFTPSFCNKVDISPINP